MPPLAPGDPTCSICSGFLEEVGKGTGLDQHRAVRRVLCLQVRPQIKLVSHCFSVPLPYTSLPKVNVLLVEVWLARHYEESQNQAEEAT